MNRNAAGFVLGAAVVFLSATVFAAPSKKEEKVVAKTGVLSTSAKGDRAIVIDTNIETAQGERNPAQDPIAGSFSRVSQRDWKLVVANNSEDPYSVDITVDQFNSRRAVVKRDHYSYRLAAGETVTRTVAGAANTVDGTVRVDRVVSLVSKAKAAEAAATPAAGSAAQNPPAKK
jgi:hypothetical protein